MGKFEDFSKTETYKRLNTHFYTLAQTSRLCGVSKGRISRWLRGYEYTYDVEGEIRAGSQDSIVERVFDKDSASVSFLELIDLLFVKRFLEKKYSLQKIRRIFNATRLHLETPHFASARFYVFGTETILEDKKMSGDERSLLALFKGGQRAFSQLVEQVGEKIDFEDVTEFGLAQRWYPRGKDGHIMVDPKISFGQPTIIGTRITTDNIFDLYIGENEKVQNVSSWFDLPLSKIDSAVAFEQSINA